MQPSIVGKEKFAVSPFTFRGLILLCLILAFAGGVLGGCVSSEKYEAEKARSLNFQRLLAQEEKRTGELNVKYQEAQRKVSDLESQNRDLTTEMDALREQLDRTQSELTRVREGDVGDQPSPEDDLTLDDPSISEFGLDDLEFQESDLGDMGGDLGGDMGDDMGVDLGSDLGSEPAAEMEPDFGADMGNDLDMDLGMEPEVSTAVEASGFHTVTRGDTLYSLSKRYGVTVDDLKNWNGLNSDLIRIGQQLRVSP